MIQLSASVCHSQKSFHTGSGSNLGAYVRNRIARSSAVCRGRCSPFAPALVDDLARAGGTVAGDFSMEWRTNLVGLTVASRSVRNDEFFYERPFRTRCQFKS